MGATMTTIHALFVLMICRAQFTATEFGSWHLRRGPFRAAGATRYQCARNYAIACRARRRRLRGRS